MAFFGVFRWFILTLVLMLAISTLGVAGHFTHLLYRSGEYIPLEGLVLATAALTVLTLPIMLLSDLIARRAYFSRVNWDLLWLFMLWALWLPSAALASHYRLDRFSGGCIFLSFSGPKICRELRAIEGISYASWILLMLYTFAVFGSAIVSHSRGHRGVWQSASRGLPYTSEFGDRQRGNVVTTSPTAGSPPMTETQPAA
ncbi:hypothetical protein BDN71DRAFT_1509579 [Pleurotus eryngii]|uniref:MARVEL domain-containing protein n=1 Tax=Pleurotus eryngii TaxID=5323 RepID=A0A9P5ZRH5_PLEER|nr:hypothetical protein BDN71DRAFT_1509579 [Pleurotus eryngii]